MLISLYDMKHLLCNAITHEILILTEELDLAVKIREEFVGFARKVLSLKADWNSQGVNISGYNYIYIMELVRWNALKRAFPFNGKVFITDKALRNVQNIGDSKVHFLPLNRGESNDRKRV